MTRTRRPAFSLFFLLAGTALVLGTLPPAQAQDGPPPHVRRLVGEVLELLRTQGDAGLTKFLDAAVDPAWPARDGRDAVLKRIGEVRAAAHGLGDDVGVEREDDGVSLILGGPGVRKRVRLVLGDAGIGGMSLPDDGGGDGGGGPTGRDGAVRSHIAALEGSGRLELDALVQQFEQQRFSAAFMAETTQGERRALLEKIRGVAAHAEAVMLDEEGNDMLLKLRGPVSITAVFTVEMQEPFGIDSLRTQSVDEGGPKMTLTWEGAGKVFKKLEKDGFSGVVHLSRNGKTYLHEAYGMANAELGYPSRIDTAYCIGSTPIDFTVAAVNLLTQRGKLDPDAGIGTYLKDVPADKASMTVAHLISGRSGLPDFHDIPSRDWDADLAWIDRDTAVRRILAQPLLFAPGTSRAHSHSAYGLATAIVELVSGRDYFTFVNDNFFKPAGMTRTGMYGVTGGLTLKEFAVGRGSSSVGMPNIPPNWGPTSWLVLGSGGMYSTLDDLLKFRAFAASDKLFEKRFAERYSGSTVGVGGSERGFYVFHATLGKDSEALMIMNGEGRDPEIRALSRALERLVNGEND